MRIHSTNSKIWKKHIHYIIRQRSHIIKSEKRLWQTNKRNCSACVQLKQREEMYKRRHSNHCQTCLPKLPWHIWKCSRACTTCGQKPCNHLKTYLLQTTDGSWMIMIFQTDSTNITGLVSLRRVQSNLPSTVFSTSLWLCLVFLSCSDGAVMKICHPTPFHGPC